MSIEVLRARGEAIAREEKLIEEGASSLPENVTKDFRKGLERRKQLLAVDIKEELGGIHAIDGSTFESADDRRALLYMKKLSQPVRTFRQVLDGALDAEAAQRRG